jgi:hypothetical protein
MANYRRNFLPGCSYFFTVNLADRRGALLTDHIDLLRAAFRQVRARHPFMIEAAAILPAHLSRDLDYARRRCRFRHALAPDQKRLFAWFAASRTDLRQPRHQSRARNLAAAVLGTHSAQRKRFCAPPRLHPLQSGEARSRNPRARLAPFLVSPLGAPPRLSSGLGPRSRRRSALIWRKVTDFAALNPSYALLHKPRDGSGGMRWAVPPRACYYRQAARKAGEFT